MEFKSSKGIFQQIGDSICERILSNQLTAGEKLLSVREQAALLGVNQNTIMRTYTELQRDEIIANKRGIGYFVTNEAKSKIKHQRKEEFFSNLLPDFVQQIKMLQLSEKEMISIINQLKQATNENK